MTSATEQATDLFSGCLSPQSFQPFYGRVGILPDTQRRSLSVLPFFDPSSSSHYKCNTKQSISQAFISKKLSFFISTEQTINNWQRTTVIYIGIFLMVIKVVRHPAA